MVMCGCQHNKLASQTNVDPSIVGSWVHYEPKGDLTGEGFGIVEFSADGRFQYVHISYVEENMLPSPEQLILGTFTASAKTLVIIMPDVWGGGSGKVHYTREDDILVLIAKPEEDDDGEVKPLVLTRLPRLD